VAGRGTVVRSLDSSEVVGAALARRLVELVGTQVLDQEVLLLCMLHLHLNIL